MRKIGAERLHRLTDQIQKLLPDWRLSPVVRALQALRGVAPIVAVTTIAEIGDMSRFAHPRQLMAYLGLVPSEDSTGDSIHRGSITKTGNGHVRRATWVFYKTTLPPYLRQRWYDNERDAKGVLARVAVERRGEFTRECPLRTGPGVWRVDDMVPTQTKGRPNDHDDNG